MKSITLRSVSAAALMAGSLGTAAGAEPIIAQWDFNQGDLRATAGEAMEYLGDTADHTTFTTAQINGGEARVMRFPGASSTQGYRVTHEAEANGGGTKVNQYTLIMDLMYPVESNGQYRAILQTGDNSQYDDADFFVHPSNAIGVGNYHGMLAPGQWHRVALVVDQSVNTLNKYIDGELVGTDQLTGGVDGPWALGPNFLLFADNDGDTAPGFVNSVQFRGEAMTEEDVAELGGASSGSIPPFEEAEPVELQIVRSGANVVITALNSSNVKLQRKMDLGDDTWANVPGLPENTNSFTIPAGEDAAFFRAEKLD